MNECQLCITFVLTKVQLRIDFGQHGLGPLTGRRRGCLVEGARVGKETAPARGLARGGCLRMRRSGGDGEGVAQSAARAAVRGLLTGRMTSREKGMVGHSS